MNRPFQQDTWMHTLALPMGLVGSAVGAYWLSAGLSPWWLVASVAGHLVISISSAVGYHRFFTHRSFDCPKFWQVVFAVVGTLSWIGSPINWAVVHTTHHKYADTLGDPHNASWAYVFWKARHDVPLYMWRARWLLKDPLQRFIHNYFALVPIALMLLMLLAHPMVLVFGYLIPLAVLTITGSLHQAITHRDGGPRDMPYMEFVLPLCGEWLHGKHHRMPSAKSFGSKWWHPDLGALVIRMIERRA